MKQTTVIGVKQQLNWNVVDVLLETFNILDVTHKEKQFSELLSALKKYVDSKIAVPFEEIGETYVIVENERGQKSIPCGKPLRITVSEITPAPKK